MGAMKRCTLGLLTSFLLISLLLGGGATKSTASPPPGVTITILHVNDVDIAIPVDGGRRGGLARVGALKRAIQEKSPHVIFVLPGDTISPSVASGVFKGEQMISTWNALGLDYACFGNHEFDMGDDILVQRMKQSRFKWLAANVVDARTKRPFGGAAEYDIRTIAGVKIGFLGLTTVDTRDHSRAGADVTFLDPIETARRLVPEMRRQGATVIVALTHLEMDEDKRLAQAVPVDLILGGHNHEWLQSLVGHTPIFKVGSQARTLGRVDLNVALPSGTVRSIDWQALPVVPEVGEDAAVAAIVARYEQSLAAEMDRPVGRTLVPLDALSLSNRTGETNLGDYIIDAYREAAGADIALMNGGAIRPNQTFGPGVLSRRDIVTILPYENPVVKVEVAGSVVRLALEHGVSHVQGQKECNEFPHVSGLRFRYDPRRPAGSRVVEVTVGGSPLQDGKLYTLALNSYLLGGGDGYKMFKGARLLSQPMASQTEPAILLKAIARDREISPRTDGRVQRVDDARH